ncbi:MAG: hypothetical protein HQK93_00800, partial [Nitrospirae bacterium]|nr:hypothetical protein [Nitrospirota bacterium]
SKDSPFNPEIACNLIPEFKRKSQYHFLNYFKIYSCITYDIDLTGRVVENDPLITYMNYCATGLQNEVTQIRFDFISNDMKVTDSAKRIVLEKVCKLLTNVIIAHARVTSSNIPNKELNTLMEILTNKVMEYHLSRTYHSYQKWKILGLNVTLNITNQIIMMALIMYFA